MTDSDDDAHVSIDTAEDRVRAMAGTLYYVAQIDLGYETHRVFDALPATDRAFFERVIRLALGAVRHWRQSDDPVPEPVTAPLPARLVLALVPKTATSTRSRSCKPSRQAPDLHLQNP